jgi:hypothetical protein
MNQWSALGLYLRWEAAMKGHMVLGPFLTTLPIGLAVPALILVFGGATNTALGTGVVLWAFGALLLMTVMAVRTRDL